MNLINVSTVVFCAIGFLGAFALVYVLPVISRKTFDKIFTKKKTTTLTKIFLWYFFIGGFIGILSFAPSIMNYEKDIDRIEVFVSLFMCLGLCLGAGLRLFKNTERTSPTAHISKDFKS